MLCRVVPWVANAYALLGKPAAEMTVTELKEFLQSHGIAGNARKERLVKCAQLLAEDAYMALNNETLECHHPTPREPVTLVRLRSLDELERIADGLEVHRPPTKCQRCRLKPGSAAPETQE